ncbi:MAG: hypothetical protein WCW65_03535, partial [Candidatus Paceibacterota bacterium]
AEGFGNKVTIIDEKSTKEYEPTEEELQKIEDAEDAIADELTEYFKDERAFKFSDLIDEIITALSSFDRDKLYNRNKFMAKAAKLFVDAEKYAESLHDCYKDIDWGNPIAEKDIETEDEFNAKKEENSEIKHISVH